jgi:transposase
VITGGHEHEARVAPQLFSERSKYLIADKGYDSNEIRSLCVCNGMTPVIPSRKCRVASIDYDRLIYKDRNVIERFFAKIKQFRRIATRYDKTVVMFLGGLTVASILIWLKV